MYDTDVYVVMVPQGSYRWESPLTVAAMAPHGSIISRVATGLPDKVSPALVYRTAKAADRMNDLVAAVDLYNHALARFEQIKTAFDEAEILPSGFTGRDLVAASERAQHRATVLADMMADIVNVDAPIREET